MNGAGALAVGVGAALGAWLRWALAVALNAVAPQLPLGTLAANLIGGYFIGVAVALLMSERWGWAGMHIGSHLVGSIALTILGIWTVKALA